VSAPQDPFEASRIDKLHAIEALGLDPWGGRFDGHAPLAEVRALPADGRTASAARHVSPAVSCCAARGATSIFSISRLVRRHLREIRASEGGCEGDSRFRSVAEAGRRAGLGSWPSCSISAICLAWRASSAKPRRGELTVFAETLTYLGKSLLPHPDKHGGMQDLEFRLRHRYLDLIYNSETLERAHKRILIVRTIRRFLDERGFWEVETPTLHSIAGGAAARPFLTHHNALDIPLYQRIALELHLKRLLVGGIEKVYEIGRVFRNEGISPRHNPEFTMMELYEAYGDYGSMMDLTEQLIVACVQTLSGGMKLPFGEHTIDFTPPWQRTTYGELFEQHVGASMNDVDAIRRVAEQKGFSTAGKDPAVIVHHLFEEHVEDKLIGPVFVYDYPAPLCPLTKRKQGNSAIAERFELYVRGMELANAYTELNDPITQEETFRMQLAGLPEEDSMAKMDEDFIRALRHGMPPAGGLGIGIDRLVMLLTNTTTIRDVILFPLLRPEKK
jgi:lysyl-tRNA synthetase class 2